LREANKPLLSIEIATSHAEKEFSLLQRFDLVEPIESKILQSRQSPVSWKEEGIFWNFLETLSTTISGTFCKELIPSLFSFRFETVFESAPGLFMMNMRNESLHDMAGEINVEPLPSPNRNEKMYRIQLENSFFFLQIRVQIL